VIGDPATAMRDPVFYRLHSFVDDIFQEHKATLPRYDVNRVSSGHFCVFIILIVPVIHMTYIRTVYSKKTCLKAVFMRWETLMAMDIRITGF
jgi:hypothetical protein